MTTRLLCLLACLGLLAAPGRAQDMSVPHSSYAGHDYGYFAIRLTGAADAGRFSIVDNPGGQRHADFIAAQPAGKPFLLVNAGISDQSCQPLGYYASGGTERQPVNLGAGAGNFYLQPNGAFVVTSADVAVVESHALAAQTSGVVYGIQSGPLLVQNGAINGAFNASSPNRHVRCGVGTATVGTERYVYFAIANDDVTFYELAAFFRDKLKCQTALCLESAGCDLYFPDRELPPAVGNLSICRYIRYVVE